MPLPNDAGTRQKLDGSSEASIFLPKLRRCKGLIYAMEPQLYYSFELCD